MSITCFTLYPYSCYLVSTFFLSTFFLSFYFPFSIILDKNNILLPLLLATTSFFLGANTIRFCFFLLEVYIWYCPSYMAFLLYFHGLSNHKWHAFIDTTLHRTPSKYLLPIENKTRQCVFTIISVSLFRSASRA